MTDQPLENPAQKTSTIGKHPSLSPAYRTFERAEWANLRAETPMTLSISDVEQLTGLLEPISLQEVREVYLPLTRLINLYAVAAQSLHRETNLFLRKAEKKPPFIIGIAGSVAVGKSTMARILRALLARWSDHAHVALVPTDGFLWPNAELEKRGLMAKKGFPESYDARRLVRFLSRIKAGDAKVTAPVYSHFAYDILPQKTVTVSHPDILIIEGLNVLQPARQPDKNKVSNTNQDREQLPYVSDFFDFSIYMDARENLIESWYVERFMVLRQTAFQDPDNYFHRYSRLDETDALKKALDIWRSINLVNLKDNIENTRQRADLVLHKGRDHAVETVFLRKH